LFGGWNFQHDVNEVSGPPINGPVTGNFSDGWTIGGAIGRRLSSNVRVELEGAFRSNAANQASFLGGPFSDYSGHNLLYTSMTNLYYDANDFCVAGMTPYIGGGVGAAFADGDFTTVAGDLDVHDGAFAYQLMTGLSKQVCSSAELFAEYRYFGTSDMDIELAGTVLATHSLESENVFFGMRWNR
jgi:opacity protein-like surface antigen